MPEGCRKLFNTALLFVSTCLTQVKKFPDWSPERYSEWACRLWSGIAWEDCHAISPQGACNLPFSPYCHCSNFDTNGTTSSPGLFLRAKAKAGTISKFGR